LTCHNVGNHGHFVKIRKILRSATPPKLWPLKIICSLLSSSVKVSTLVEARGRYVADILQLNLEVISIFLRKSSEELPQRVGEMSGPGLTPSLANAVLTTTGLCLKRIPTQAEDLPVA
jgi:hypothetical protein